MLVFKILSMLWPFIKEMLFGQKTMAQILKEHKGLVAVGLISGMLLVTNVFLMKRIVVISHDYITLRKKYETLVNAPPTLIAAPVVQPTAVPAVTYVPPKVEPTATKPHKTKKPVAAVPKKKKTNERYERLQKSFIELQSHDSEPVP